MTNQQTVGVTQGVSIAVVAWDGSAAQAGLSFARMFERELADAAPTGGLLHLDAELGGRLVVL